MQIDSFHVFKMLRLHSSLYVWSSVNVTKKGKTLPANTCFILFRGSSSTRFDQRCRNWTLIGIELWSLWSLSLFGMDLVVQKIAMIHIKLQSLYVRMQDAPGFLECFVYSVQFLLFVCLESHLFRVLCTGNGGVPHWNHLLSSQMLRAKKNGVAMVSKMLQHLQAGMKREVPFGKFCDFIENRIQE